MEFRPEKKLGFGLMRLPQNDPADAADIDIEQVKAAYEFSCFNGRKFGTVPYFIVAIGECTIHF